MRSIEERIIGILLDDFKVEYEPVGGDTTFEEMHFDSLVLVELTLVLDNEFGIAIEYGELTESMTIAEAAKLVLNKSAAA